MGQTPRSGAGRLVAIDWMRGFVMVLMAVDHGSAVFNVGKMAPDSAWFPGSVGADLTPNGHVFDFLTRWVSHLCAPTFVFLAGTSIALSTRRRLARGASAASIDLHLAFRGLLLILFEAWMSLAFALPLLQVLYAIGACLICMTLLRRLGTKALLVLGLGWIVAGEWVIAALGLTPSATAVNPEWGAFLFTAGFYPFTWFGEDPGAFYVVAYALVPWLAIMALGWAFGDWLLAQRDSGELEARAARRLTVWGSVGLAVFTAQRLLDGGTGEGFYGNLWLPRSGDGWLTWLQVSKYPPSLAFAGLDLGLMALCLALLFRVQATRRGAIRDNGPLLVFGQTALFFYLLHIHLLRVMSLAIGMKWTYQSGRYPVESAWISAAAVLVVLYPLCRWFRAYKAEHPGGILRYL